MLTDKQEFWVSTLNIFVPWNDCKNPEACFFMIFKTYVPYNTSNLEYYFYTVALLIQNS